MHVQRRARVRGSLRHPYREDERLIRENLSLFFEILSKWDCAAACPADPGTDSVNSEAAVETER